MTLEAFENKYDPSLSTAMVKSRLMVDVQTLATAEKKTLTGLLDRLATRPVHELGRDMTPEFMTLMESPNREAIARVVNGFDDLSNSNRLGMEGARNFLKSPEWTAAVSGAREAEAGFPAELVANNRKLSGRSRE